MALTSRTTQAETDPRPPLTRRMRPGDHITRAVVLHALAKHHKNAVPAD